ncbi:MAG: hypothetical protein AAFR71_03655 [Pseudomonadota bacterium]
MPHQLKLIYSIAFCAIAMIVAAAMSFEVLDRDFLQKVNPTSGFGGFSGVEWLILALCALAAWVAAVTICPDNCKLRQALCETPQPRFFALMTVASFTTAIAAVALTLYAPIWFRSMMKETKLFGVLQEVFILIGLVALVLAAFAAMRTQLARVLGIRAPVILFGMVAAILFLFLEEISYGQHYFGWSTPEKFAGNVQNETNLHNFYTYRFELVFYSGALAAFVILPLLRLSLPALLFGNTRFFVPPLATAVVALPMCALVYESWSIVIFQFYAMLIVALPIVVVMRDGDTQLRRMAAIAAAFNTLLLFFCVQFGRLLDDGYEYSEMRELIIAILICTYGVWLWRMIVAREQLNGMRSSQEAILASDFALKTQKI